MARPRPGGISDPHANVPPFPEEAEWFLRRGQQVDSHEHRERRERVDDDEIPEWAHVESGVGGSEYVVIDAGDPIPAEWIEPVWSSFSDLYDPLDENGERIRHGDDRDPAVSRAAAKIAAEPAAADDEPPLTLDDVSLDDLDDLDYQQVRSLASRTDGIDGNGSDAEIRAALRRELADRDADAVTADETADEHGGE